MERGKAATRYNIRSRSEGRAGSRNNSLAGSTLVSRRFALSEIKRLCSELGIDSDVAKRAFDIYSSGVRKRIKGRTRRIMIVASLYAACREAGLGMSLKEISRASNLSGVQLGSCYRQLVQELELDIPVIDLHARFDEIARKAGIEGKTVKKAADVLDEAEKAVIASGKNPAALAAAAIYLSLIHI